MANVKLSDNAMNIIRESQNGQPLQFVNPDYRNYSYNAALPNAVTQISMPIPAKFSSLKSLFMYFIFLFTAIMWMIFELDLLYQY